MKNIAVGYGWKRVRLDNGETVEALALNGELPEYIEWPPGSGQLRRIEEWSDAPPRHLPA